MSSELRRRPQAGVPSAVNEHIDRAGRWLRTSDQWVVATGRSVAHYGHGFLGDHARARLRRLGRPAELHAICRCPQLSAVLPTHVLEDQAGLSGCELPRTTQVIGNEVTEFLRRTCCYLDEEVLGPGNEEDVEDTGKACQPCTQCTDARPRRRLNPYSNDGLQRPAQSHRIHIGVVPANGTDAHQPAQTHRARGWRYTDTLGEQLIRDPSIGRKLAKDLLVDDIELCSVVTESLILHPRAPRGDRHCRRCDKSGRSRMTCRPATDTEALSNKVDTTTERWRNSRCELAYPRKSRIASTAWH